MNVNGFEFEKGVSWIKESLEGFNAVDYLHENPTTVLVTMGCLTFGSILAYVCTQPSPKPVPKRRFKPTVKKVVLTPTQLIDSVLNEFNTDFVPLIGKLKTTVVERITELQSLEGEPEKVETGNYRDALEYQAKYLEESLLKLIMKLDGVETGEDVELKTNRKAAVKALQMGHREVDNLSVKIAALKARGVLY